MNWKTCILYKEWSCDNEHLNPGSGEGSCLSVTELRKGEPFPTCRKCADVILEGACPKKRKTPYDKVR